MPDNTYKDLWLHDENETITVLPYTTLDNIKIRQNNDFSDFKQSYTSLQSNVNINRSDINTLTNRVNNFNEILHGTEQPDSSIGKDGDLYVQYKNDKIDKLWNRMNGEWYFFNGGGGGPAVSIGKINISKKPKININLTISNYEGEI